MESVTAFHDLPNIQFQQREEGPLSTNWSYHTYHINTNSELAGIGCHVEGGSSLPPFDRFMHDHDSSPFSSEYLFTDRNYKNFTLTPPATLEPSVPDIYFRHASPGTEASTLSCDTFSCHTDELQQCNFDPRSSLGSSDGGQHGYFSQGSYGAFPVQPLDMPFGGGSCSLGQVQNFEDPACDPEQDHTHSELDGDGESDHGHEFRRQIRPTPYSHISEDEGLGESIQDSTSDQLDEDDDEDPEYNPKSSPRSPKLSRPRRASGTRRFSQSRKNPTVVSGRISKPKAKKQASSTTVRPFPCPLAGYSCVSTFTSKNEWKRHVSTQHIKLGFWRCDMCQPSDPNHPVYNDFNRKDLFTQHLRRMHANHPYSLSSQSLPSPQVATNGEGIISEEAIATHQSRCFRHLRTSPPQSNCLFCPKVFQGDNSWDERMDHVGAHLERERKSGSKLNGPESWRDDPVLRDWLEQEGLIENDVHTGTWRLGDGQPRRRDSAM